jgi:hemerythrin
MPLIEWRDEFSIGLPGVDQDHRELIGEINRLHEQIRSGTGAAALSLMLGGIQTAIAAHFALEEKDMASLGYDQLATHKVDHERLLDDILDIIDDVCDGAGYDPSVLSGRLADWFGNHFRTHDARLHAWLVGQQNGVL